jgi:hypothetical protein
MSIRAFDTVFKVGYLYLVGSTYLLCSRTTNGAYHSCSFRSFPDCKPFSNFPVSSLYSTAIVIAHNVPFCRHTHKGRERIRKWQEAHPELFI